MTRRVAVPMLVCALTALALTNRDQAAQAYPEPSIVPKSWSLDFEYQKPRPIAVEAVDGSLEWYWYMTYKVTNNSGRDQLFIPEITVATDGGEVITAGKNVPPSVFQAIKKKHRNPLLESPVDVVGTILQGVEFAKESVAIWPAFEGDVDAFSIFVAGLSGETAKLKHPLTDEEIMVRRTLMLSFDAPGSPATPQDQPIIFDEEREVMR